MALRGDDETGASAKSLIGYLKKSNGWLEFLHIAVFPNEDNEDNYDSYSDDEDEGEEDGEEIYLPGTIRIKRIESYYGLMDGKQTVLISKSGDTYKISHPFEEIRKLIHED